MRKWIINNLERLVEYLKQEKTSANGIATGIYSSLAPKVLTHEKDLERVTPYLDALQKCLEAKEIYNIALTGGYGSGKSTIIKTFQAKNSQYKYLNLSLASFKDNIDDEEKLERKLEISILQQIFYHVKPSQIPDSRFKRIVNTTNWKLLRIAVSFIIWLYSTFTLIKFGYLDKLDPKTWDISKPLDFYFILILLLFLIGIGFFSKVIFRLFSNSKINKLNIKGELELGDQIDKSVFNQHLEEILYFFERTEFNVVVIEDLDRFNSTDIFTKLRELNILINKSTVINRKIKFLYAVKDEMFNDKTKRVKFFDFIIPVIPFINPSNASEQLTKLIEDAKLQNVLSPEFYEDVVTFIDDIDMRLLINIFHEYCLYRENLSKQLNQDELFSIIVYKNMFPDDFGDLAKRRGKLYKVLLGRTTYIGNLIKDINKEVIGLRNQIKAVEKERISSVRELRSIYLNAILSKLPNLSSFSNSSFDLSLSEALEDENFEAIYEQPEIKYNYLSHSYSNYYNSYKNNDAGFSFADVEKEVNPDLTYKQREALIIDKSRLESLKTEIQKLERKRNEIESWTLQQIFQEQNIDQYLTEFTDIPLVKNLIINGYLNENYTDYISLFHEINLTKEDFEFEKKLKSGSVLPYDYKLTKTENLIKKINFKYLSREGILNYDLLDCLLKHKSKYGNQLTSVLQLLSNEKESSKNFIISYLERNNHLELFIPNLSHCWENFWNFINSQQFTKDRIDALLLLILQYADLEDIAKFQQDENDIIVYIEDQQDALERIGEKLGYERFKTLCDRFSVKFQVLKQPSDSQKNMFLYLYENNHYALNKDNIAVIIDQFGSENRSDNTASYFSILDSGCANLISYVEEEIEDYVQDVLLDASSVEESKASVVRLLNNVRLSNKSKISLIKKLSVIIEDLSLITDTELWRVIFDNNKVEPSWINVYKYYEKLSKNVFDETIVSFLNHENNYTELGKSSFNTLQIEEEDKEGFTYNIIYCKEISLAAYKHLQESIPFTYALLEYSNIDEDRCRYMIDSKFVDASIENFNALQGEYQDLHLRLVENNPPYFLDIWDKIEWDEIDVVFLMGSKSLSVEEKTKIIELVDELLIIENKTMAERVAEIILQRHVSLSFEVIEACFSALKSHESRIKLIINYSHDLDDSDLQSLVESLGEDYSRAFEKQNKPVFPDTALHRQMFEILKERGLIIRYERHEKHGDKLRVIAKY